MKLKTETIVNVLELSHDDVREALIDYFWKKVKDDPSLLEKISSYPHNSCGVLAEMDSYDPPGKMEQDAPHALLLRWLDEERFAHFAGEVKKKIIVEKGRWWEEITQTGPQCKFPGCTKAPWTRPNGEAVYCSEHETEEYRYRNNKMSLL